jgi:type II protein arginine methyltransferase
MNTKDQNRESGASTVRTKVFRPGQAKVGTKTPILRGPRTPKAAAPSPVGPLNGQEMGEIELLERAFLAGACSPEQQRRLKQLFRRRVPRWHFPMLNDVQRNAAFESALGQLDLRGKVVLDIGSGSGLLAMMAARLGAEAVVSCEAERPIAAVAQQIVKQNGFADKVTIVPAMSFDLDPEVHLPRPADVLVTEIVDCGLVGEGMFPTVRHARKHLLRPDASILPAAAKITGRLIESDAVRRLNSVSRAAGFDVSAFNRFSTADYFPCRLNNWPHRFLSGPTDFFAFDFRADPLTPQRRTVTVKATGAGTVHGVAFWWQMAVGQGVALSNGPDNPESHWMQAVALLECPLVVRPGQPVVLEVEQDDEGVRFSN